MCGTALTRLAPRLKKRSGHTARAPDRTPTTPHLHAAHTGSAAHHAPAGHAPHLDQAQVLAQVEPHTVQRPVHPGGGPRGQQQQVAWLALSGGKGKAGGG